MSCNYADGLSPYENKGVLGQKETFDSEDKLKEKCILLANWISQSKHVVVHTGAGISTSAGIPDFRGPNGVWTLEKKGLKPNLNISFDDARPTKTHMALYKLVKVGEVQYIVSQNIDGLHLKSGLPRSHLAELHGNIFIEQCNKCERQFVRSNATTSVGKKCLNTSCRGSNAAGRCCRGKLYDTILDWEDNLPEMDLSMSEFHSSVADLSICLGTTLQIVPSGTIPLKTKKNGGRLVIVNLQPTKHDQKADLRINAYVDEVLKIVMNYLGLEIPEYSPGIDPTKNKNSVIEWTMSNKELKKMKVIYNDSLKNRVKIKRKANTKKEEQSAHLEKVMKKTEHFEFEIKNEPEMCSKNKVNSNVDLELDNTIKIKNESENSDMIQDIEINCTQSEEKNIEKSRKKEDNCLNKSDNIETVVQTTPICEISELQNASVNQSHIDT